MTGTPNAFDLTGKTALITGGSRGLGLQIAEALGAQGARLIIAARKANELQDAQKHLRTRGVQVDWIAADGQSTADLDRLVAEALVLCGNVHILVNNAGATWGAPSEDHSLDAWDKVMNLNVRATFYLTQQVAKRSMIPARHGKILNIASIGGLKGGTAGGVPTLAYNTSKAAVVNMTRTLAVEWAKYSINVNALAPGYFLSKMTRGVIESDGMEKVTAGIPLGRIGDTEDLKGAALLFCSAAGKHITGQTLAVDGGATAV